MKNYTGFRRTSSDKNQAFSYEDRVRRRPGSPDFPAFTLQGSQVRNLHFPPEFAVKLKACNVQLQAFFSLYGKSMENIPGPHWMMLVVGARASVRDSPSGPRNEWWYVLVLSAYERALTGWDRPSGDEPRSIPERRFPLSWLRPGPPAAGLAPPSTGRVQNEAAQGAQHACRQPFHAYGRCAPMRTLQEILGYWHKVADRPFALPQKGKLETACDRANYLEERRAMMQRSPDYIDHVVVEAL